jgi:hypothetical protein
MPLRAVAGSRSERRSRSVCDRGNRARGRRLLFQQVARPCTSFRVSLHAPGLLYSAAVHAIPASTTRSNDGERIPKDSSSVDSRARSCRRRSALTDGSSVTPSAPQLPSPVGLAVPLVVLGVVGDKVAEGQAYCGVPVRPDFSAVSAACQPGFLPLRQCPARPPGLASQGKDW